MEEECRSIVEEAVDRLSTRSPAYVRIRGASYAVVHCALTRLNAMDNVDAAVDCDRDESIYVERK